MKVKEKVAQLCPTLRPHGLYSPWNSPGQNTGVGNISFFPGDLPNLGIKPRSPALRVDSLPAEPQGKPINTTTIQIKTIPSPGPIKPTRVPWWLRR